MATPWAGTLGGKEGGNPWGPGDSSSCTARTQTPPRLLLSFLAPPAAPQICFYMKTVSGKGVHDSKKRKPETRRAVGGICSLCGGRNRGCLWLRAEPPGHCGERHRPNQTVTRCHDSRPRACPGRGRPVEEITCRGPWGHGPLCLPRTLFGFNPRLGPSAAGELRAATQAHVLYSREGRQPAFRNIPPQPMSSPRLRFIHIATSRSRLSGTPSTQPSPRAATACPPGSPSSPRDARPGTRVSTARLRPPALTRRRSCKS